MAICWLMIAVLAAGCPGPPAPVPAPAPARGAALPAAPPPADPAAPLPPPLRYTACRANQVLKIDGRLDEPDWQQAVWTTDFVDISSAVRPRLRTRVKMMWNWWYLYVGAELEEPHLWATCTRRDQIVFQDNDFEVFVDPDGDGMHYFEIELNARNTLFDLFLDRPYSAGGSAVHDWDFLQLVTAVATNGTLNDPRDVDGGWTLELAIPWSEMARFSGLPSPPDPGDTWRVNFSRVQWQLDVRDGEYVKRPATPEDNWVWSPQGAVNMHLPERWGYVTFVVCQR